MRNTGFLGMLAVNILLMVILFFYVSGNKGSTIVAPSNSSLSLQQQIIDSVSKISPTVVQIIAEDTSSYYQEEDFDKNTSTSKKNILKKGSGILCSKKGYIITNNHVVDNVDLKYSVITSDGKTFPVKKLWKDELIDTAILLIDFSGTVLSEATFIDSTASIEVGQFVLALGNSLSEYPNTTSLGIISGKGRKLDVEQSATPYYAGLYQTDAALNPGNSGGPLVNLSGEVFGMVTAISRGGNNIGFALPLNQKFIDTTLALLDKYSQLSRPYLGITYTDTEEGAKIDTIFLGSSLEGFLQVGDTITALDTSNLSLHTPLLYHLYMHKPGETVIFSIKRANETLEFPIVLGQKIL